VMVPCIGYGMGAQRITEGGAKDGRGSSGLRRDEAEAWAPFDKSTKGGMIDAS
jgi:hypothetical protein